MLIRPAALTDAPAITEVHIASWRTTYTGLVPADVLTNLSYERRLNTWREILTNGEPGVFVAEDQHRVVGFANGGKERTGDPNYTGELYAIYLLRTAQKLGAGRKLAHAVAAHLLAHGHHSMLVWVLKENPARAFYEKLGGHYLYEKIIEIGVPLSEVAYGWRDLTQI